MKQFILSPVIFTLLLFTVSNNLGAQTSPDPKRAEIQEALNTWNTRAKAANTDAFMDLFDNTAGVMLVGSDSGEIFKGKEQISNWVGGLFKNNSFEWEMNQVEIDYYQNTAWVFVGGAMIVTNKKGNKNRTPYRFTGIMVKTAQGWKWRLFNGSIPRGE